MARANPLGRMRKIIARWPQTEERLSHGAPTFWGGKRTFATFHDGHYDDGRPAIWCKAPDGVQEALVESDPDRFYRPKYLGPSGWVGIRLHGKPDWGMIEGLLEQGYRLVAPKKALADLDAKTPRGT